MTVSSINELKKWLELNKISEVECVFPDMAGSSKGKILPVQRFIKSIEDIGLSIENQDSVSLMENFNIMASNCGTCHKKFRN